jgi:hypothetical protein
MMLSVAFLFWAANQPWPDLSQATLFNDIAIALFVLDVFLVMVAWPSTSPDESFAETHVEKRWPRSFQLGPRTGNNARRPSLDVESLILLAYTGLLFPQSGRVLRFDCSS